MLKHTYLYSPLKRGWEGISLRRECGLTSIQTLHPTMSLSRASSFSSAFTLNHSGVMCLSPVISVKQDSNQWLRVWVKGLSYQNKDIDMCVVKAPA